MSFTKTSAALSVLAAAVGTALIAQIPGVQAETVVVQRVEAAPVTAPQAEVVGASGMVLPDFRTIVRENTDAIVKIEVRQRARRASGDGPQQGGSGDPFEEFMRRFGQPGGGGGGGGMQQQPRQGMGSGFIIGRDGRILTNAHVVKGADEVIVRLSDQREMRAKVIGLDERTDVAVVKIDAKDLPTVRIGKSENIEVGEWVLAIGAPFGLDYSATQGIVSATGRQLPNDNFVPFIQTDAAVNPGNSGGPLFNVHGEVIGINSQIYSQSGGYMGLNFAIPIKTAMGIAAQLESKGFVERGWLGVGIQTLNPQLARQFGMEKPTGALIGQVGPGSPADQGGLKAGDVILKFNGVRVKNSPELPPLVAATDIGQVAKVEILRGGATQILNIKVGKLKEERQVTAAPEAVEDSEVLDLTVADLSSEQREQLGLARGGALVTGVRPGPAAEAGVQRGDVVLEVNRRKIQSAEQFGEVVKGQAKDEPTLLLLRRGASSVFVVVDNAA